MKKLLEKLEELEELENEDGIRKETNYELRGYMVITDWNGRRGIISIEMVVDEEGLKEIEQNPLQDFAQYGAKSIDYVRFNVYKIEVEHNEKEKSTLRIYTNELIKTIEEGNIDNKELQRLLTTEPVYYFNNKPY